MNVAERYAAELRENREIIYAGLTFYPLTVRHYALYRNAQASMELMQASLPPALARLSWFRCLDELDRKCIKETGKNGGYLVSVLGVLATALRLDLRDRLAVTEARDTKGRLNSIVIRQKGGGMPVILNMEQMGAIREILAAQNGYELPDENWNLELMRAEEYTSSLNAANNIQQDLEELVYSVAVNTGYRAGDIWDWPIREFMRMQDAVDRKLGYEIYTMAECAGTIKFKHGNPYPTWKFKRRAELPGQFKRISELEESTEGLLQTK